MKFCGTHWGALRAAIDNRGLSSLIPESGDEAVGKLVNQVEDGPRIDNFDPLMGAHNAIVANVMGLIGIAALFPNDDGSERCPLCYLNADHEKYCAYSQCGLARVNGYDVWIDNAADEQLAVWKSFAS